MTKIDIISGFLGSGKTTFIKHLLKDISQKEKIVIIENEIGEVNFDAQELEDLEISIKELTSGCICCTLSINLITLLNIIDKDKSVDRIIIEPTGLANLSDLLTIFNDINEDLFKINLILTILDPCELEGFAGNFGNFFSDQICNSKVIILSKTEKASDSDKQFAKYYVKNLNPMAQVIDSNWDEIKIDFLEKLNDNIEIIPKKLHNTHNGKHSIDGFENFTIRPKNIYSKDNLNLILEEVKSKNYGDIIRMKGYLSSGEQSSLKLDYVLGQIYLTEKSPKLENLLVIIGKDLETRRLENLFN